MELFVANQVNPIKFVGERYSNYTHGICIPPFDSKLSGDEDKIVDLFSRIRSTVLEYNKSSKNPIRGVIYNINERILPVDRLLPHIDKVIRLLTDNK